MSGDAKATVWCFAIVAVVVLGIAIGAFVYNGYKVSHQSRVQKAIIVKVQAP